MYRTPIKTRGKRRVPARTKGAEQAKASSARTRMANIASTLQPSHIAVCSSRLELLPTEVLEVIFFHSLNISLPQASPAIGQKLASNHVKSRLVLKVFSAPNSLDDPCEAARVFSTRQQRADAQSAILRQRWMTLPFLTQLIPESLAEIIVRELGTRKLQWMDQGLEVSEETEPVIRKYLTDSALDSKPTIQRGLPACSEFDCHSKTPGTYKTGLEVELRDGVVTLFEDHRPRPTSKPRWKSTTWRILHCVEGCQIPEKLLHGPWTEEKCAFLELVLRGNAQVDWVTSTSGEVAEKGFMEAIHSQKHRAIRALRAHVGPESERMRYHPFSHLWRPAPGAEIPWLSEEHPDYGAPVTRGVGVVPQQKHLRAAILEEEYPRDMVSAFLEVPGTDFDFDDKDILQWVTREKALGNPEAKWLRDYIRLVDSVGKVQAHEIYMLEFR